MMKLNRRQTIRLENLAQHGSCYDTGWHGSRRHCEWLLPQRIGENAVDADKWKEGMESCSR